MKLLFRCLFLLFCALSLQAVAQPSDKSKTPRVLILLDGSSSMSEDWLPGKTRFQQAGKFIIQLIDSLSQANEQVQFGLRVFGHQYPAQDKNCYDTKREIMFARDNTVQMQARLEALRGYGVSPIAYSLSEAAMEDFENEAKYAYSIILVTDGGESCGGDICKVVNDLLQRKIFFRPYIVSLLDYAPLKDLYNCLGTFLTVSKESEAPPVIAKITEAHREGFDRARIGKVISVMPEYKKPDTITIPITIKKEEPTKKPVEVIAPPSVKKDTVAIAPLKPKEEPPKPTEVIPKPASPSLQVRDRRVLETLKLKTKLKVYKTIVVDPPSPQYKAVAPFQMSNISDAPKIEVVVPPPAPKVIVPERKLEKEFKALKFSKRKPVQSFLVVMPTPKKLQVPPMVLSKFEPELVVIPDTIVIPITIKKEEPRPVVKPMVKPSITTAVKPILKKEETPYVVEKTPAAETQVEIFFTDGNGKFYATTPQILLSDPQTGKDVHTFYRTVNAEGNPDAVKAPTGNFNLSVVGSDRTFLKGVEIAANMKNKIMITVGMGSLQFVWKTGNKKRPVSKYFAQVKRNFVPQPMIEQRCDTILPYPPGNYHVEINTMPVSVRSLDLNFGEIKELGIDVPGTVRFTNTNSLGKVSLYYPLGDRYVQFWQMNITGNPSSQVLELKPGPYEAHYSLAPGLPEKVFKFQIKSDETVLVELQ
jgi:hypothetical protein